eukprot:c19653_g1_i1.p1 GENE.c19653_g1_i1~~c19653_g1_i1.p1  ORF type:complete len:323 (+),score=129.89 c19653_g1_i1:23-991(+)
MLGVQLLLRIFLFLQLIQKVILSNEIVSPSSTFIPSPSATRTQAVSPSPIKECFKLSALVRFDVPINEFHNDTIKVRFRSAISISLRTLSYIAIRIQNYEMETSQSISVQIEVMFNDDSSAQTAQTSLRHQSVLNILNIQLTPIKVTYFQVISSSVTHTAKPSSALDSTVFNPWFWSQLFGGISLGSVFVSMCFSIRKWRRAKQRLEVPTVLFVPKDDKAVPKKNLTFNTATNNNVLSEKSITQKNIAEPRVITTGNNYNNTNNPNNTSQNELKAAAEARAAAAAEARAAAMLEAQLVEKYKAHLKELEAKKLGKQTEAEYD